MGLRGEKRTERNTPAIPVRSDEETTSVAGRATPDKPPCADAPRGAVVWPGEWCAICRRPPPWSHLLSTGGSAVPAVRRSIPPVVASSQRALVSRDRSL